MGSYRKEKILLGKIFHKLDENSKKVGTTIVPTRERLISLEIRSPAITIDSRSAAFLAANAAESKKAHGTVILDVRDITLLADFFVIAGGETSTQVKAIVDAIDEGLSTAGYKPHALEGKREGRWVLLDYGDVIVHVLQDKERTFYKLEQFWNQALVVERKEWSEE